MQLFSETPLTGVFADKQLKVKHGKEHAESDCRFCIDCGVKKRIYQPGQMIDIDRISLLAACGSKFAVQASIIHFEGAVSSALKDNLLYRIITL